MPPSPDVKSQALPQYLMHDWDPESGVTLEDWARALAEQGWRSWEGTGGTWTTINGVRVYRVQLRREAHLMKAEIAERRAEALGS